MLYITLLMNALTIPTQQLIPAIGRDQLGVGPVLIGLLVAASGFGQLLAAGVVASMRSHQYHGRIFVAGTLISIVMALLFVWSPWYAISFAIWTGFGIGQLGFGVMQSSIIMLWSSPGHARKNDRSHEPLHRCWDTHRSHGNRRVGPHPRHIMGSLSKQFGRASIDSARAGSHTPGLAAVQGASAGSGRGITLSPEEASSRTSARYTARLRAPCASRSLSRSMIALRLSYCLLPLTRPSCTLAT